MTLIKYFYKKGTLKRKTLDIKDDINALLKPICTEDFFITSYGAFDIDPRNLVYWVCVKTDKVKVALQDNDKLNKALRQLLITHDYPADAQNNVHIGFESQETVDKESNGSWYIHFK